MALCLLAAGCGTDVNPVTGSAGLIPRRLPPGYPCVATTVSGAGSTFVQTILQEWTSAYERTCPGSIVDYQGVGSGAGIQQMTAATVDFAASDVVLKPSERSALQGRGGRVMEIPWAAGGIAVEYHLEGVPHLQLSPATLAGIFAGRISRWNNASVRADNPGRHLPNEAIQVFHRSDASGTTAVFTAYLSAAAPTVWREGTGKQVSWPVGAGVKGSDQVTAAVEQSEGSIGYSEVSYARGAALGVARIENPSGHFVEPTGPAVSESLESATVPPDLAVKVNYLPSGASAYPISTVTWVITYQAPADRTRGSLIRSFLAFVLGPGQAATGALYYAPLPPDLLAKDKAAVAALQV